MNKKISIIALLLIFLFCFQLTTFADVAEKEQVPEITARNAIMLNTNTGAIVYEKSADERIYPASLTKLVTMLVTVDMITDYNAVITASDECYDDLVIGSSNMNLQDGEQISINDIMYGVAISSANEAANALAIHLCGSVSEFVNKMNAKVTELGTTNTHFANTHGLHNEDHYTTARDMLLIAKAAFSNETIYKYLSDTVHEIAPTNKTAEKRTLITTNSLLRQNSGIYYKYCRAGKTGTTTPAGYNLISIADRDDSEFILVAMNAEKNPTTTNTIFDDSRKMYVWAFDNYKNKRVLESSEIITEVEVKLSAKGDHLVLLPEKNMYSVVPIDMDITTFERDIVTNEEILAPINAGDKLGTITLKKDGVVYATTNLIAADDVERSTVLYYLYLIEIFFQNIWVRIICGLLVVFLIIYIIIMISQNNRRKKKRLRSRIRF